MCIRKALVNRLGVLIDGHKLDTCVVIEMSMSGTHRQRFDIGIAERHVLTLPQLHYIRAKYPLGSRCNLHRRVGRNRTIPLGIADQGATVITDFPIERLDGCTSRIVMRRIGCSR